MVNDVVVLEILHEPDVFLDHGRLLLISAHDLHSVFLLVFLGGTDTDHAVSSFAYLILHFIATLE